jgi:pentatricopeptide repeat protein
LVPFSISIFLRRSLHTYLLRLAQSNFEKLAVNFIDESDPDFELKELQREILQKAEMGHWKAATRKLKKYTRRISSSVAAAATETATDATTAPAVPPAGAVPLEILQTVLEACMVGRLQGARAAEPARKILEQYVEFGYNIPESVGNYCIKNCLGDDMGPHSTHQGFGGIDTALAMMAALEQSGTNLQLDTMEKITVALAREGSMTEALATLRQIIVNMSEIPTLATFAAVAEAAVANPDAGLDDKVLEVLTLAKAAGFELDSIAKTQDGRVILSAGLVAAERLKNLNLGLRLLTAARTATPDDQEGEKYDKLVVNHNRASKRASVLIHKDAINKAVIDNQWKLAVKLLELKLERDQNTSSWVWRNVVTCCAKADKSRKATALLLDWVNLYEQNKADKPPLNVFNTVVNACEICDEHELTLLVLDSMKKTHDTEGNIITFNIALKRLAKQGSSQACEGIIIGMLQAGIEPTVVSYTTAIAACVNAKEPKTAYEWLKRMRSRLVNPNMLTYNTAFAACVDGTLESTLLSSKIATEWISDIDQQLETLALQEDTTFDEYTSVIPDSASKHLARKLIEQLDQAIARGEIDERVAAETVRKALNEIADFDASERASKSQTIMARAKKIEEDQIEATSRNELELEFEAAAKAHRTAEV